MTSEPRPYLRALPCVPDRPDALALADGWQRFREVEVLYRGRAPEVLPAVAVPELWPEGEAMLARLTAPRAPVAGLGLERPRIMGVLNVTPDSFSDGGLHGGHHDDGIKAVEAGLALAAAGADMLDVGGESTRPGAVPVAEAEELDRVLPVIEGLRAAGCPVPVSIDTRKAAVARAALEAGAALVNDVSALSFDGEMAAVATGAPALCLMHAQGDPQTMQDDPRYDDVLLDVYDFLEARLAAAEAAGVARARVILDPGIGFGKRLDHNLALLNRLSLFHALGCPVLLGASRKRFIGTLSGVAEAAARAPGSVAAALAGVAAGVQILRVHDVAETAQALAVWQAIHTAGGAGPRTGPGTGPGTAHGTTRGAGGRT